MEPRPHHEQLRLQRKSIWVEWGPYRVPLQFLRWSRVHSAVSRGRTWSRLDLNAACRAQPIQSSRHLRRSYRSDLARWQLACLLSDSWRVRRSHGLNSLPNQGCLEVALKVLQETIHREGSRAPKGYFRARKGLWARRSSGPWPRHVQPRLLPVPLQMFWMLIPQTML